MGANDFQARIDQITKDTDGDGIPEFSDFGSCVIPPPADVSSVSFDVGFAGASCTPAPPGTDAIFTLVEPQAVVGGEVMSIDTTALFVAGAFTNAYWILPAIGAAIAGFGLFRIKK